MTIVSKQIILLEKINEVYQLSGLVDSLDGGSFPGIVRPILYNNRILTLTGFISADRKRAFLIYNNIHVIKEEFISITDVTNVKRY
jgi:hypothetical protein